MLHKHDGRCRTGDTHGLAATTFASVCLSVATISDMSSRRACPHLQLVRAIAHTLQRCPICIVGKLKLANDPEGPRGVPLKAGPRRGRRVKSSLPQNMHVVVVPAAQRNGRVNPVLPRPCCGICSRPSSLTNDGRDFEAWPDLWFHVRLRPSVLRCRS